MNRLENIESGKKVAVIIPCYNEGGAIKKVILDFRDVLQQADIYVFDNNSTDNTIAEASDAGALVFNVRQRGKGNVVRRMFADVEADVYLMVDGDATYNAASALALVDKLQTEHLDMVVGTRYHTETSAYRAGHTLGNKILTGCVKSTFGGEFSDMLSGYRAFSRRYVKSFPAMARGFEIETELTVHALELRMPCGELATPYRSRQQGSISKLNTYRDGIRILRTIIKLYSSERPLRCYGLLAILFATTGTVLALPLVNEFLRTGLVPRLPTAVLSTGLMTFAAISFITGLILESVTVGRRELKRLVYLSIPS